MYFKKISIYTILLITFFHSVKAQTHEIGLFGGVANYKGELSPIINILSPRPYLNVFYRANISSALSIRANFAYAELHQDDAKSNDTFAQLRNHSFNTTLLELSAQIEYNFLKFRGNQRSGEGQSWTPYLFAGVGLTEINPQDNIQPNYSTSVLSIPLGLGFKGDLGGNWNLGAEFGARFTSSDFLDDLGLNTVQGQDFNRDPQYYTGNPNDNDIYFFTGISISYVFPDRDKCPIYVK